MKCYQYLLLMITAACASGDPVPVFEGEEIATLAESSQALTDDDDGPRLLARLETKDGQRVTFYEMFDGKGVRGLTGTSIMRSYLGPKVGGVMERLQAASDRALTNAEIFMSLRGTDRGLPSELAASHFKEIEVLKRERDFMPVSLNGDFEPARVVEKVFDHFEDIPAHHHEKKSQEVTSFPRGSHLYGCTGSPHGFNGQHVYSDPPTDRNSCAAARNLPGWLRVSVLNNTSCSSGCGVDMVSQLCWSTGPTAFGNHDCFLPQALQTGWITWFDWVAPHADKRMWMIGYGSAQLPFSKWGIVLQASHIVPD